MVDEMQSIRKLESQNNPEPEIPKFDPLEPANRMANPINPQEQVEHKMRAQVFEVWSPVPNGKAGSNPSRSVAQADERGDSGILGIPTGNLIGLGAALAVTSAVAAAVKRHNDRQTNEQAKQAVEKVKQERQEAKPNAEQPKPAGDKGPEERTEAVKPTEVKLTSTGDEASLRSTIREAIKQAKEGKPVTFSLSTKVTVNGADGQPLPGATQASILYDELKAAYPERAFVFSKPDLKPNDSGYKEFLAPEVKKDGLHLSTKENQITIAQEFTLPDGTKVPAGSKLSVGTIMDGNTLTSADPTGKVWAITKEGNKIQVADAGKQVTVPNQSISSNPLEAGQIANKGDRILIRSADDAYPIGEGFEKSYKPGTAPDKFAPRPTSADHFKLPGNVTVEADTKYGPATASGAKQDYFMKSGFADAKDATAKNYAGVTDPRSAQEILRIRVEEGLVTDLRKATFDWLTNTIQHKLAEARENHPWEPGDMINHAARASYGLYDLQKLMKIAQFDRSPAAYEVVGNLIVGLTEPDSYPDIKAGYKWAAKTMFDTADFIRATETTLQKQEASNRKSVLEGFAATPPDLLDKKLATRIQGSNSGSTFGASADTVVPKQILQEMFREQSRGGNVQPPKDAHGEPTALERKLVRMMVDEWKNAFPDDGFPNNFASSEKEDIASCLDMAINKMLADKKDKLSEKDIELLKQIKSDYEKEGTGPGQSHATAERLKMAAQMEGLSSKIGVESAHDVTHVFSPFSIRLAKMLATEKPVVDASLPKEVNDKIAEEFVITRDMVVDLLGRAVQEVKIRERAGEVLTPYEREQLKMIESAHKELARQKELPGSLKSELHRLIGSRAAWGIGAATVLTAALGWYVRNEVLRQQAATQRLRNKPEPPSFYSPAGSTNKK
jgi:hypothetical protein